jgi:inorganic pyrophosphatase
MRVRVAVLIAVLPVTLVARQGADAFDPLSAAAVTKLIQSLEKAKPVTRHAWRDQAPINADGTVNAYIETSQGDRRKWELNMAANALEIDRVTPAEVGGSPTNYGFVPQTMFYDGDPLDAIVLGPAVKGGETVRGAIVGLMLMEDEKGVDSKIVLSPVDANGRPRHQLTDADRRRISDYFSRYKGEQAEMFSNVPGWGSTADALRSVQIAHAFFRDCRKPTAQACRVRLTAR